MKRLFQNILSNFLLSKTPSYNQKIIHLIKFNTHEYQKNRESLNLFAKLINLLAISNLFVSITAACRMGNRWFLAGNTTFRKFFLKIF